MSRLTDQRLTELLKICNQPIGDEWTYDDDEQLIRAIGPKRGQFIIADLGAYSGEERWATMRFIIAARESLLPLLRELQERRQRPRDEESESVSDARGIIEALLEECRGSVGAPLSNERIEDAEQWLRGTFESERPGDAATLPVKIHIGTSCLTRHSVIEQAQKVADAWPWQGTELTADQVDGISRIIGQSQSIGDLCREIHALALLLPPKEPKS